MKPFCSPLLFLSFLVAALLLQACSEKSEQEVRAEAVKILIYNDGRVFVNGNSIEPGDYDSAIKGELLPDSEIWYWREDPYGIPKGNGREVSAIMAEVGLFRAVKIYSSEDFIGDYVEVWDGQPNSK
ncbi:MAG: hypothetical protein AAGB26_08975 [Planctomycetota bacterium]